MKHISINHLIIGSFDAQFASMLGASLTAIGDIIIIGNGFGANKAALEISMDNTGCHRRRRALCYGLGPRFLRSDGKERQQVKQPVTGPD